MTICRYCRCPITGHAIPGETVYVVDDGGTTSADGLAYCPPNPDYQGDFRDHVPVIECDHVWIAGMMHVHSEDVAECAKRRKLECEQCDATLGPTG